MARRSTVVSSLDLSGDTASAVMGVIAEWVSLATAEQAHRALTDGESARLALLAPVVESWRGLGGGLTLPRAA
jgi:hypothetical protein